MVGFYDEICKSLPHKAGFVGTPDGSFFTSDAIFTGYSLQVLTDSKTEMNLALL